MSMFLGGYCIIVLFLSLMIIHTSNIQTRDLRNKLRIEKRISKGLYDGIDHLDRWVSKVDDFNDRQIDILKYFSNELSKNSMNCIRGNGTDKTYLNKLFGMESILERVLNGTLKEDKSPGEYVGKDTHKINEGREIGCFKMR